MMHLLLRVLAGVLLLDSLAFAQFDLRYFSVAPSILSQLPEVNVEPGGLTELPDVFMNVMPDMTVSWEQPDDGSTFNGRCGETAAANIVSMVYRKTSPKTVSENMSDVTPGTHPETLSQFLNHFAPGTWSVRSASFYEAFHVLRATLARGELKGKNRKAPVAALIQSKAFSLHWVTVVDIDSDNNVVYNEGGFQKSVDVATFIKGWGFNLVSGNAGMAIRATLRSTCCSPYTFVAQ